MTTINDFLSARYEAVYAPAFYRDIFPHGSLDIWRDSFDDLGDDEHKYCGIAVEVLEERKPDGRQRARRYTLTDDRLEEQVNSITWGGNFCVTSPISYIGKKRDAQHARNCYGLVFDVDHLRTKGERQIGLEELIYQWTHIDLGLHQEWLPKPTYIVASGNGIHLYYLFDHPLPLFEKIARQLQAYKDHLTWKIWNGYVVFTSEAHQVEYQSIYQGFRMVGGTTKDKKEYVRAYRVGEHVSIEYLNRYIGGTVDYEKHKIIDAYRSTLSLAEAARKYPEWYQHRIIEKRERGSYIVSEKVYEWWIKQIYAGAYSGHRYWCIWCLVVYALKCGIEYDRVRRDALGLVSLLDSRTTEENNHFTETDVLDALEAYKNAWLVRYPLEKIEYRSGIKIKRNKRNGRKMQQHVKIMNAIRDVLYPNGEWRNKNGRPNKGDEVSLFRIFYPSASKADCVRITGLDKKTVSRWWDTTPPQGRLIMILSGDTIAPIEG